MGDMGDMEDITEERGSWSWQRGAYGLEAKKVKGSTSTVCIK